VARKLGIELVNRAVDLRLELGVTRFLGELEGRVEIVGAGQDAGPQVDLGADAVCLAQDVLGGSAVFPEPGLGGEGLQLGQTRLLAREVKAAPTSTGSARRGRGRARRPLVLRDPQVLEQDRTELDQAECRLAPDDDGVHAGTVAVVGANAAVAIAVKRRGVAAVAAITFTGDQVDECPFLSLFHESLTSAAARIRFTTRDAASGAIRLGGRWASRWGFAEYRCRISLRQEGKMPDDARRAGRSGR
jgi:hypothetical protein